MGDFAYLVQKIRTNVGKVDTSSGSVRKSGWFH